MNNPCTPIVCGDRTECQTCGCHWDTNDSNPPRCPRQWEPKSARPDDDDDDDKSPIDVMAEGIETFRIRNEAYGENYKHFGQSMIGMFPEGLTLRTVDDWNRIALVIACVSKLGRYAANTGTGGHFDSAKDLAVYAAILGSITKETPPSC